VEAFREGGELGGDGGGEVEGGEEADVVCETRRGELARGKRRERGREGEERKRVGNEMVKYMR
jgi:hypothetical protein